VRSLIFLVDMNAFYIGCEMTRIPELKDKPAAVAGDPKNRGGIILSPNYKARKFGVKTTMLVHEARRLCPEIVFVPPDHGFYSEMSGRVMKILERYAPVVQQSSIDEAYLDLTGCECLFGKPVEIAEKIMRDIQIELDLWCSIGISENKFLAKMASEMKKPLGITEMWQSDIKEKLWPLRVREMNGIGKQTEKKLNNMAIFTIGDIAKSDRRRLIKEFGKFGQDIFNHANGIDNSKVDIKGYHENKSISRSTTLPEDTTDMEYLKTILLELSEEVGHEARRQDYKGKTVSIVIKYNDFQTITRQRSSMPTNLTKEIYETGARLLVENWNKAKPIRLIGIGIGGAGEDNNQQLSLFDMAKTEVVNKKEEKLEKTLDSIKEKYGLNSIKRARLISSENKE
jgi:DNA polymerase IV